MGTISEKGHAKNIANAVLFMSIVKDLNTLYNPSNPYLQLANLEALYHQSNTYHLFVNNAIAPYSLAVDDREKTFALQNQKLSRLRKAYKATQGVSPAMLEDFMTIYRKLKGIRKTPVDTKENKHSVAQTSYDQRTSNYELLISLLQNTPYYNPNEVEFQVATLRNEKEQMLQKTSAVNHTFIPLNTARNNRNNCMYLDKNNLVDTYNLAKDYIGSILDPKSAQYKQIAKIKFRKI